MLSVSLIRCKNEAVKKGCTSKASLKEKSGPGFNWFQKKEQTFFICRKVKIWCDWMKSMKVVKFWILQLSWNVSWTCIQYEYANKWVNDVIASQFSIYFVHRSDENSIFELWESKTSFKSILNICKIMFALILKWGHAFTFFEKKKKAYKKKRRKETP